MRAATHLAFAGLAGVVGAGFGAHPGLAGGAALALGALLPDVDTRRSRVGRALPALSAWLERRAGHRTVTHSLPGLAALALLASPLLLLERRAWVWLLVGALSHLLIDTANVSGVPLFWPARLQVWLVHNRGWRVPVGSARERVWFGAIVLATLALLPVALGGFTPWFHRALGTPYGAVADYLRYAETHEVFARVRGANLVTGERIAGEYRVVGALDTEMLLLEDASGRAFSAGLGQRASIATERIAVRAGERVAVRSAAFELAGRSLGSLEIDAGSGRAYLTGSLLLEEAVTLPPAVGTYARVRVSGRTLELRAATPAEVAGLAGARIVGGRVLVRVEVPVGDGEPAVRLSGEAVPELVRFGVPGLPASGALAVGVGSGLEVGTVVARYPEGAGVRGARVALERALVGERSLRERYREEVAEWERDRERLRGRLARLEGERDRVGVLVAAGAEPVTTLQRLERGVAEVLWESEDLLSERADLERGWRERFEAEGARVDRLRGELAMELERLVVRSPLAGVVNGVRIVGMGVRGIDIELLVAVGE